MAQTFATYERKSCSACKKEILLLFLSPQFSFAPKMISQSEGTRFSLPTSVSFVPQSKETEQVILHDAAVPGSAGCWCGLECNMACGLQPELVMTCRSVVTWEEWAMTTGSEV